jgi:hypothetical protein
MLYFSFRLPVSALRFFALSFSAVLWRLRRRLCRQLFDAAAAGAPYFVRDCRATPPPRAAARRR